MYSVPLIIAAVLWAATPARADVEQALADVILPGYAAFAAATHDLNDAALVDCTATAVAPAYQAAFDAWTVVADLRLGPAESGSLGVAFWPDERGTGARTLTALIAANDPVGRDPAAYATVSVAARGLSALDLLLFDPDYAYASGDYTCALVQTISADLVNQAQALLAGWHDHAALMRDAGAAGNTTYLDETEVQKAIFTQILTGFNQTYDARLGRPMGTFDRPRPTRAEAWRSGRPLANVVGTAQAATRLARALSGQDLPLTDAAWTAFAAAADRVSDPTFQTIADPQVRLQVEILQQRLKVLKDAVEAEVGTALNISAGFNALDGD